MGFFSESKPNTPEKTQTLSPDTLNLLNLTPKDREDYKHLLVSRDAIQKGMDFYKRFANSISSAHEVDIGEIKIPISLKDQPDENRGEVGKSDLISQIYSFFENPDTQQAMHALPPEQAKVVKTHLQAFGEGYAMSALDAKDWKTAIKSYDKITEGGIIQKPDVIKKLADSSPNDTTLRNQMADLIEQLLSKQASAKVSGESPTPSTHPTPTEIPRTETITPTPTLAKTATPTSIDEPAPTSTRLSTYTSNPSEIPQAPKLTPLSSNEPPIIQNNGDILRPAPPNPNA